MILHNIAKSHIKFHTHRLSPSEATACFLRSASLCPGYIFCFLSLPVTDRTRQDQLNRNYVLYIVGYRMTEFDMFIIYMHYSHEWDPLLVLIFNLRILPVTSQPSNPALPLGREQFRDLCPQQFYPLTRIDFKALVHANGFILIK